MKKSEHSILIEPSDEQIVEMAIEKIENAVSNEYPVVLLIAEPSGFEIISSLDPEAEAKFLIRVITSLIYNLDKNVADLARAFGEMN